MGYLLAPSPLPDVRLKYAYPNCPAAFIRDPPGWFAAYGSHSRVKDIISSFSGILPKYFR